MSSTSTGPGRILIAVYAVFALAATGRSSVQLIQKADEAPLAYGLSALAAVVYIAATVGLAEVGPSPRRVAWTACLVEMAGVLVVGTLSLVESDWFPDDTVWSRFGSGYGWLPLVLPFLGVAWLLRTRPEKRTLGP
ncbi:hypothetical protein [Nocardioides sp. InS609-2]|uniref:hypothetical protein n=1 Tax=Nocardioides sp. InS609-2 TaxID=2760705 RepID=UPI0020BD6F09|nr:hypothetical protein [Nocardioides sp. InS609-2]